MGRGTWEGCALALLVAGVAACGGTVLEEPESEPSARVAREANDEGGPTGTLLWSQLFTGPDDNTGSIVRDREGGFLAVVNFSGSSDPSERAMALARYDVQGRLRWMKVLGGAFGIRHTVDRNRDIVLVVQAGGVDFGSGPVFGQHLVKLDAQGRLRWLRRLSPDRGFIGVNRVVTDREDNIGLGGTLVGTVDFGRGPVSSKQFPEGGQSGSAFLAKFSPEGENLWTFADSENQSQGLGATADSQGNFLLSGTVFTTQTEPFVLMLSPEGHVRWVRRLEGALGFARSVATHGNRVVVVGTFARTFTFAGRTHTASPNGGISQDGFVVAFTRDGEERWASNFAFSAEDVAMDEKDGVVVAGSYEAGRDDLGVLGPLPGNPGTLANFYVARFNRLQGEPLWSRGFVASGPDTGSPGIESASVAVTEEGRSAVLGQFTSTLTVGSEVWEAEGRSDLFLLGFER